VVKSVRFLGVGVVIGLLVGGVAYAAIPDANGVIATPVEADIDCILATPDSAGAPVIATNHPIANRDTYAPVATEDVFTVTAPQAIALQCATAAGASIAAMSGMVIATAVDTVN
jgi:hypothetical protein